MEGRGVALLAQMETSPPLARSLARLRSSVSPVTMAREFRQVKWSGAAARRSKRGTHCVSGIHLAIVKAAREQSRGLAS